MLRGSQPAAEGCQGSRRGRSSTERRQGRRASRRRSGIYRGRRGGVASGLLRRGGRVILLARPDFSNFTTAEVKPTMSSWSCRYQKAASPQSRACVCLLATLTLVTSSTKVNTPGTLIVVGPRGRRRSISVEVEARFGAKLTRNNEQLLATSGCASSRPATRSGRPSAQTRSALVGAGPAVGSLEVNPGPAGLRGRARRGKRVRLGAGRGRRSRRAAPACQ